MTTLARRLQLRHRQSVSIGGALWAVSRESGDGVTADKTTAGEGTARGYLHRAALPKRLNAAPDEAITAAPWAFLWVSGAVQFGDTLTAGTISFRLGEVIDDRLHTIYRIER